MEVDVEILDVNEEEARALLLSIDPLAALAQTQEQLHQRLLELTPAASPELEAAWQESARAALKESAGGNRRAYDTVPEQFLILVKCRDERQQVELLERFHAEGLDCRALLS
jgi:hypothetical protein